MVYVKGFAIQEMLLRGPRISSHIRDQRISQKHSLKTKWIQNEWQWNTTVWPSQELVEWCCFKIRLKVCSHWMIVWETNETFSWWVGATPRPRGPNFESYTRATQQKDKDFAKKKLFGRPSAENTQKLSLTLLIRIFTCDLFTDRLATRW